VLRKSKAREAHAGAYLRPLASVVTEAAGSLTKGVAHLFSRALGDDSVGWFHCPECYCPQTLEPVVQTYGTTTPVKQVV
jgi:hypothetical protein